MDADLQDDPAEIPHLVAKLDEGYDLVSGWKQDRKDGFVKNTSSRFFNAVTSRAVGLRLHDYNCGLKAYRREVVEAVRLYGEMHRYIPAQAYREGFRVTEIPVRHHRRRHGVTKYGPARFLNGFLDLLTLMFLSSRSASPLHLFGRIGAASFAVGRRDPGLVRRAVGAGPRPARAAADAARRRPGHRRRPVRQPRPDRRAGGGGPPSRDGVPCPRRTDASASDATPPSLAVIVVNWNGRDHLPECIGSLLDDGYDPLRIDRRRQRVDGRLGRWFCRDAFPSVEIVDRGPQPLLGGRQQPRSAAPARDRGRRTTRCCSTTTPSCRRGASPGWWRRPPASRAPGRRPRASASRTNRGASGTTAAASGAITGWVGHQGIRQAAGRRALDERFVEYGTGCALLLSRRALDGGAGTGRGLHLLRRGHRLLPASAGGGRPHPARPALPDPAQGQRVGRRVVARARPTCAAAATSVCCGATGGGRRARRCGPARRPTSPGTPSGTSGRGGPPSRAPSWRAPWTNWRDGPRNPLSLLGFDRFSGVDARGRRMISSAGRCRGHAASEREPRARKPRPARRRDRPGRPPAACRRDRPGPAGPAGAALSGGRCCRAGSSPAATPRTPRCSRSSATPRWRAASTRSGIPTCSPGCRPSVRLPTPVSSTRPARR